MSAVSRRSQADTMRPQFAFGVAVLDAAHRLLEKRHLLSAGARVEQAELQLDGLELAERLAGVARGSVEQCLGRVRGASARRGRHRGPPACWRASTASCARHASCRGWRAPAAPRCACAVPDRGAGRGRVRPPESRQSAARSERRAAHRTRRPRRRRSKLCARPAGLGTRRCEVGAAHMDRAGESQRTSPLRASHRKPRPAAAGSPLRACPRRRQEPAPAPTPAAAAT